MRPAGRKLNGLSYKTGVWGCRRKKFEIDVGRPPKRTASEKWRRGGRRELNATVFVCEAIQWTKSGHSGGGSGKLGRTV